MEAMQAHLEEVIAIYRPYRHHVTPLFDHLGLKLDEAQELAICLLTTSFVFLLATFLLGRVFAPAKQRPLGEKKNPRYTTDKHQEADIATSANFEVKGVRKDANETEERHTPLDQKELRHQTERTECRTGREDDYSSSLREDTMQPQELFQPETRQPVEKEIIQHTTEVKQEGTHPSEGKSDESETTCVAVNAPDIRPVVQGTESSCEDQSDERPGTMKQTVEEEEQPATPLRRSSRVKSTPQKFSPSGKKRVRKVD